MPPIPFVKWGCYSRLLRPHLGLTSYYLFQRTHRYDKKEGSPPPHHPPPGPGSTRCQLRWKQQAEKTGSGWDQGLDSATNSESPSHGVLCPRLSGWETVCPGPKSCNRKITLSRFFTWEAFHFPKLGTAWLGQGPFRVGFTNISQKSIIFLPSYWVCLSRWLLLNLSRYLDCIDTQKSHRIIPVPRLMLEMFLGKVISRLPRWHGDEQPTFQCRRCKRFKFHPLVGKIPWRRKWQHSPVFLLGKPHGAWWAAIQGVARVWLSRAQGNIQCLHSMVPETRWWVRKLAGTGEIWEFKWFHK